MDSSFASKMNMNGKILIVMSIVLTILNSCIFDTKPLGIVSEIAQMTHC